MATKEELYEAAKLLREHCLARKTCMACQFATEEDGNYICALHSDSDPESWRLRKPSRWTEADVLMAKALKAFGATYVVRSVKGYACDARKGSTYNSYYVSSLPEDSFKAVSEGEPVKLDDIIKEAEDDSI